MILCITFYYMQVCFELLDTDNDGRLNEAEMKEALEMLITIYHDNQPLKMDSRGSSNNEETSVTVDAPADEGTPPDNEGTPPANEGTPPANEGTPPANEGITPSDEGATPNSEPSDNRQPCCDVDLILEQFKENFQVSIYGTCVHSYMYMYMYYTCMEYTFIS